MTPIKKTKEELNIDELFAKVDKLKTIITSITKMQNEIIIEQATCKRSGNIWAEEAIKKTNVMFSKLSEV